MEIHAEYLERIESALDRVLPALVDTHWISKVAGWHCGNAEPRSGEHLLEPGRALLRRGGKRWRPLVSILTCEALNGGRRADVLTSLSEIPHNGSLIIDDIEDEALTRRGGTAIHNQFGIDLAINMGNLMYFLPSMVFCEADFDDATVLAMMQDWNIAMRRLHLGQGYDIVWHNDHPHFPDRDSYLRMCRFKTGSLAALAARLGARAALSCESCDGNEDLIETLGTIWESIGLGFQIFDDAQNLHSGIPGKDAGDDIVEGKKSLPVILHLEKHPEDAGRLVQLFKKSAELAPKGDWSSVHEACDLLRQSGAVDEAFQQGRNLLDSGKQQLLSVLPKSPAQDMLMGLVAGFLKNTNQG